MTDQRVVLHRKHALHSDRLSRSSPDLEHHHPGCPEAVLFHRQLDSPLRHFQALYMLPASSCRVGNQPHVKITDLM